MPYITLIGTVHEENGVCNLPALYQILERAQPEVIFLEIPPSFFDQYYKDKNRENLESNTVNRYLEAHSVELVPVDVFDVPEDFFDENRHLHRRVEAVSFEYRRLIDWHSQYVGQYGFAYLNSKYCSDLWRKLDEAIDTTISDIADEYLLKTYEHWKEVIENRDREMVKNILKYTEEHEFDRGILLVGASHLSSIVEKARTAEDGSVVWRIENGVGLI